jgi:hypothetical protein
MPITLRGTENLHTLDSYTRSLGVICNHCGHRALLSLKRLNAHSGNMGLLTSLRLLCAQCKARDFGMLIFKDQAELDAWEWELHAVVKPSF